MCHLVLPIDICLDESIPCENGLDEWLIPSQCSSIQLLENQGAELVKHQVHAFVQECVPDAVKKPTSNAN